MRRFDPDLRLQLLQQLSSDIKKAPTKDCGDFCGYSLHRGTISRSLRPPSCRSNSPICCSALTCKFTSEAIVTEGNEKGEFCTYAQCLRQSADVCYSGRSICPSM